MINGFLYVRIEIENLILPFAYFILVLWIKVFFMILSLFFFIF
jgi:hypothetical protein